MYQYITEHTTYKKKTDSSRLGHRRIHVQSILAYTPAWVASMDSQQHVLLGPGSEGNLEYCQFVTSVLLWLAVHSPICDTEQHISVLLLLAIKENADY
jgi:hypothetical protein